MHVVSSPVRPADCFQRMEDPYDSALRERHHTVTGRWSSITHAHLHAQIHPALVCTTLPAQVARRREWIHARVLHG